MQVHLEIADDAQLRKAVRDLIRGQITSIVASENIEDLVIQAITKKVGNDTVIQAMVKKAVDTEVRNKLTSSTTFFIEPKVYIRDAIREIVEKQVNALVSIEMIQGIIKDTVESFMKKFLNLQ